jgi:hypothetical protein
MEELVLTDPVVEPEKVSHTYRVISLTLEHESTAAAGLPVPPGFEPGLVLIQLKDNLGVPFTHRYTGQQALDYIKFINTANFTTKSLHKRILERLSTDGVLPGTVTGTPDPPVTQQTQTWRDDI